jgi:predicted ribosome quality control (RQC) complex YloA/Tae2 family protein
MTNETSDAIKELTRQIRLSAKTIDLIYKDGDIIQDILHRLTALESAVTLQREKAKENTIAINSNINEVKDTVEAKIDEVNVATDERTVIVKSPRESVLKKIIDKVTGKKVK